MSKQYEITFPDGHKEVIIGMRAFCRKHKLHDGNMSNVVHGRHKQHKGFKARKLED